MSASTSSLENKAATLPREPGVYLFKNARGTVLYVGKAKSLRTRVRQYLNGTDTRMFVPYLVRAARDVECVVVRTEKEALILENTLIKKHRPRYNIKLVDDSSLLHLQIQPSGFWPRYDVRRHIHRDTGTRHFGPFASASRARATLEFVHRRFPLRTCTDRELKSRQRPCLMHQMGRCLAPCVDLCSKADYDEVVQQSLLFLEGRNKELLKRLEEGMREAAEAMRFEDAARIRDLIRAIQATVERQG
ncbi:MAG: GIY-YIG nuclease family protein, partial [Myxococcota bacterium]|nr:GIY-YIG nuclease family protein [Myxococcota bacterium]